MIKCLWQLNGQVCRGVFILRQFLKTHKLYAVIIAILMLFFIGFNSLAWAGEIGQRISLGGVADNILGPVKGFAHVINVACYILGAAILAGAFARYIEHRRNPIQIRLTQPILLLFLGLFIIALPIISSYSASVKSVGGSQKQLKHGAKIPS